VAELLYRMYRDLLNQLGKDADYQVVRAEMCKIKSLVVFRVRLITDLVHLDCEAVERDYRTRICGTLAVWPDATYELFDKLNDEFRNHRKNGVVYPSARHSVDKCLAIFNDQTDRVIPGEFHELQIKLRLVPEDHDVRTRPQEFSPFKRKVHPTVGFYDIVDVTHFSSLISQGWINPLGMPAAGCIDFVRRRYDSYPLAAVTPV
jgi:hypothetical protein